MGFFEKGLLLYLCISIGCAFWQPEVVIGDSEKSILGLFKIGINESSNQPYIIGSGFSNSELENQIKTDPEASESGFFKRVIDGITSFFQVIIDGLANVMGVIMIFFRFLFSPFLIFGSIAGLPPPIIFIFVIPLIFLTLIGFMKFIRSGEG